MTAKKATPPEQPALWKRALAWVQSDAPLYAIAGIAFAGSLGHEVQVAVRYGQHGAEAWSTALVIDLFCYGVAYERMRDRKKGRRIKGIVSMPTMALIVGVILTLAINLKTAIPGAWGYIIAGLPSALLLIVIALLERRESFEAKASGAGTGSAGYQPGTGAEGRQPEGRYQPPPSAEPRPGTGRRTSPARAGSHARTGQQAATAFRSEDELEAEALRILAEHKAATGERMSAKAFRAALGVQYGRSLIIRADIRDREEALG